MPAKWAGVRATAPDDGAVNILLHGCDSYAPESTDYVLSFRPPKLQRRRLKREG